MAINPVSDLVLDVARAADPQSYQTSAARLRSHAPATMAASYNYGVAGHYKVPGGLTRDNFASFATTASAATAGQTDVNPAYRKFEAFMLQNFVQSMFTGDTQTSFGKGIAGDHWKSMMADAIAQKMTDNGGIGVADMLAAGQKRADATRAFEVSEPTMSNALSLTIAKIQSDSDPESLSKDIVHGFERQLIQKQLDNSAANETPKRA